MRVTTVVFVNCEERVPRKHLRGLYLKAQPEKGNIHDFILFIFKQQNIIKIHI